MSIQFLQEFARKASNQDLVDIIATKQFSEDELFIFKTEVEVRGLGRELKSAIETREAMKNRVKASVRHMTKDDLIAFTCYNPYKFTPTEMIIFTNEVKARGLEDELSVMIKSKEADSADFKSSVLNSSGDVSELLGNFNAFNEGKNPDIAKRVQANNTTAKKRSLAIALIVGFILTAIGVGLTTTTEGNIIFIGAIVTGIAFIVRGVVAYTRT